VGASRTRQIPHQRYNREYSRSRRQSSLYDLRRLLYKVKELRHDEMLARSSSVSSAQGRDQLGTLTSVAAERRGKMKGLGINYSLYLKRNLLLESFILLLEQRLLPCDALRLRSAAASFSRWVAHGSLRRHRPVLVSTGCVN